MLRLLPRSLPQRTQSLALQRTTAASSAFSSHQCVGVCALFSTSTSSSLASAAAASSAAAAASPAPAAPAAPRTPVRSAQLRAQRPRAASVAAGSTVSSAAVAAVDVSLNSDACGPPPASDEPQMVSVVNEATGERMGPRGLEPTRYGDWEAKGRCWDF